MRLPMFIVWIIILTALSFGVAWSDTSLPREFDSLVPVYTSAQPVDTRYTRDSVTVRFATTDAFERVAVFYERALRNEGWKVSTSDKGAGLIAAKNRVNLTLTEKTDILGFVIDLQYPGGRE